MKVQPHDIMSYKRFIIFHSNFLPTYIPFTYLDVFIYILFIPLLIHCLVFFMIFFVLSSFRLFKTVKCVKCFIHKLHYTVICGKKKSHCEMRGRKTLQHKNWSTRKIATVWEKIVIFKYLHLKRVSVINRYYHEIDTR